MEVSFVQDLPLDDLRGAGGHGWYCRKCKET